MSYDGKKIERVRKNNQSKISKNTEKDEKIILKPMKFIKVKTYEDCFQIMNPVQKTVERLSKLPFKPKSQESFYHADLFLRVVTLPEKNMGP